MAANNHFNLTGGVTRAPKILENKDGSKKVLFTIAVGAGRFVDGAELTNFIPVEAFVPASFKNAEPYQSLTPGAIVAVAGTMRSSHYTDKDGKEQYSVVNHIEDIDVVRWGKRAEQAAEAPAVAEEEIAVEDL